MFGIFNFTAASSSDFAYGVSFLAVVLIALGYCSDVVVREHGFGPPVNGAFLMFGSAIGVALIFVYFRFYTGLPGFNDYKSHMFDVYFVQTLLAGSAGAILFFILTLYIKHAIAD